MTEFELQLLIFLTSSFLTFPSSAAQALWAALLEDKEYLDHFLKLNQERLGNAFDYVAKFFQCHGIPYEKSNAGHFVLINLRQHLPSKDKDGQSIPENDLGAKESALADIFLEHKILISPGASYHVSQPGWFRLTFSHAKFYLKVGLKRFESALNLESMEHIWDAIE